MGVRITSIALLVCAIGGCATGPTGPIPRSYNVVWTTQGADPRDSMPLGGGAIGLNVWTAEGEIFFEIGSPDAIDENGALLKLGRIRLKLTPNPLAEGGWFRQEFDPVASCVRIQGRNRSGSANVLLWVEVHRPVVHVQIDAARAVTVEAAFETWRHITRPIDWRNWKRHGTLDQAQRPGKFFIYPDTVVHKPGGVLWYHRNQTDKDVRSALITQQDMTKYERVIPNPTKNLTFGGFLTGTNLVATDTELTLESEQIVDCKRWKLRSQTPARQHHVIAALRVAQDATVNQWRSIVSELAAQALVDPHTPRQKTLAWWKAFWDRFGIPIRPRHA